MRETALNTKTIKLLTEESTARLPTITLCYLLMPSINVGPVAGMLAIGVANLMSEATAPCMGRFVVNVRDIIISKPYVIQRLQQPGQHPALTGRSHSNRPGGHLLVATMVKEEASSSSRRRYQRSIHQSRKHMRQPKTVLSGATPGRENGNVSNPVPSGKVPEMEGTYNRFLALQSIVKWLIAPTLRVSLQKGCTQILIQTIGLR